VMTIESNMIVQQRDGERVGEKNGMGGEVVIGNITIIVGDCHLLVTPCSLIIKISL
jgi:uncharacterized membrane protein